MDDEDERGLVGTGEANDGEVENDALLLCFLILVFVFVFVFVFDDDEKFSMGDNAFLFACLL